MSDDQAATSGEDAESLSEFMELVFGVASAVGTPDSAVFQSLQAELHLYDYHVETIKISQLIQDELADQWPVDPRPHERIELLINKGNRMCEESTRRSALAERVIDEIVTRRETRRLHLAQVAAATGTEPPPAGRIAYIVDSLKRPEEAEQLRVVYGDRFVLLGLTATKSARTSHLQDKFKPKFNDDPKKLDGVITALMKRDETEDHEYGQDVAGVLPLADAFIPVEKDETGKDEGGKSAVARVLGLFFADPGSSAPTVEEFGMQLAAQAATLSPELGLRVGAAVLSEDGQVLATGRNHHPTVEASPAFDAGAVDLRQMLRNLLDMMRDEDLLSERALTGLGEDPESYVRTLLAGPLKKSELRDITEYQRPVHAEMDALLSMMRQRVAADQGLVFVTAYPCHNCAKHLIAAGLEVIYLEPYVKSRVASMYAEHVDKFRPFSGVAPRRYTPWFIEAKRADRKDKAGVALEWSPERRRQAQPHVTLGATLGSVRRREDLARRVDESDDH